MAAGDLEALVAPLPDRLVIARPGSILESLDEGRTWSVATRGLEGIGAPRLAELAAECGEHGETHGLLARALVEQPPVLVRDAAMLDVAGALVKGHAAAMNGGGEPGPLSSALVGATAMLRPGASVLLATGLDLPGMDFAAAERIVPEEVDVEACDRPAEDQHEQEQHQRRAVLGTLMQ